MNCGWGGMGAPSSVPLAVARRLWPLTTRHQPIGKDASVTLRLGPLRCAPNQTGYLGFPGLRTSIWAGGTPFVVFAKGGDSRN